jgi:uncharacterized protein YdaU (DUF1376 family)
MAEFPALPFWTDAWLADTSHLSWEEKGLYHHLIIMLWRAPGCQIPNDESWIERRCHGNAIAMLRLCQEFCRLSEDGKFWFHRRLSDQWNWLQEKRQNNREKANYRWNKDKTLYNGIANGDAMAMPTQSQWNATKTKTKTTLKSEIGFQERKEGFKALPRSPEFIAWMNWGVDNDKKTFTRELKQRELEGQTR